VPVSLILGGARSGKSDFAERLAGSACARPIYLATARPGDAEMAERIARHKQRRGPAWQLVEEELEIAPLIAATKAGEAVLIDCLTLWLANLMAAERDTAAASDKLVSALDDARGEVVVVSNEVGCGIVPDNALARRFRDEAGVLNQRVAEAAGRVVLMAAGLPLVLKGDGS